MTVLVGLALMASACTSFSNPPPLQARWSVVGEPLLLRSERGLAGAVSSIRFRGVEFLDSADHGRLLQGAISFAGRGECDNPTLAGASSDGRGRSTSRLLSAAAGPDRYATITRMAYWLRPGQFCTDPDGRPRPAANRTRLSDVSYAQTFTPGWGHPNAVHAAVVITPGRERSSAVAEVVTAYAPPRFNTVWLFNPAARRLERDPGAGPLSGEQDRAVVLATADGASALGFLSLSGEGPVRYGRVLLQEVSKINIVHRPEGAYAAAPHPYRYVWIAGALAEVEAALTVLTAAPL